MRKPARNYVGVTGFGYRDEVLVALGSVPPDGLMMVGVLATDKTLTGEPRGRPHRYPRLDDLGGIFLDHPRCLNLVHYATRTPRDLYSEAGRIAERVGTVLDGFQFNLTWPDAVTLAAIRARREHVVVLQVGAAALREAGSPAGLRDRAQRYLDADAIDAVLLDGSGGRGLLLNHETLAPFLRALAGADVGLGVAGGLPLSVTDFLALRREFPGLSCDAEGQLRDDDVLDMRRVEGYLRILFRTRNSTP